MASNYNTKAGMYGASVCEPLHHSLVQDGKIHHLSGYSEGWVKSTTTDFMWTTGNKKLHMFFMAQSSENFRIEFMNVSTIGAAGTTLTTYNMNRNYGATFGTEFQVGVTGLTGTGFADTFIVAAGGKTGAGGAVEHEDEWIFAPNTRYAARISNRADTTATFAYIVYLHEAD